ncbi:hypothetical protein E1B28_006885 [Marasmius oreades]|uniref:BTB domain-containing protein n=1 Tax=Marasmius oreades TaxID=181124 RepID=A0A9P7S0S5_9AGAR|nr:uncharacterized protein E1B28_006885 [Marasmius oreades]KAG7093195.1 hypothetical protein E1B28_006885 [Marasmius oreades]
MSSEDNAPSSGNSLPLPFDHGSGSLPVSSVFGPTGAVTGTGDNHIPVDMILLSSDYVVFYTHEATLLTASNNSFRNLLPLPKRGDPLNRAVFVPEISSPELEVMLQSIHNVPRGGFSVGSDIEPVMKGVARLWECGISPRDCITPTTHLYQYLLFCAPIHPLEVYALAAQYGMVSLAVTTSSHTLVLDLSEISDELLRRMGAIYLLRLHQLHMERTETLKEMLVGELGLHNPTARCGFVGQRRLKENWNMAVASLLFLIKPDTTTSLIREKILEYTADLPCPDCIGLRDSLLSKIISKWSVTRRTINV